VGYDASSTAIQVAISQPIRRLELVRSGAAVRTQQGRDFDAFPMNFSYSMNSISLGAKTDLCGAVNKLQRARNRNASFFPNHPI
jgi:hypothetical protein